MKSPHLTVALALALGSLACGSKKASSLGHVEDVQERAKALGCELKYSGLNADCDALVGPCNCQLHVHVAGKFTGAADHPSGSLTVFGVGLHDCARNQSLAPLWTILDPMFDNESDRTKLHALIANPPLVKGASSDAATHLVTRVGAFTTDVTWSPKTWDAVKLPDPSLAESSIDIALFATPHSSAADELTQMSADHADYPRVCRDGKRRAWAERPAQPSESP